MHPRSKQLRHLADDLDRYRDGGHDDMERAVGVELIHLGDEIRHVPDEGMPTGPKPWPRWAYTLVGGLIIAVAAAVIVIALH